MSDYIDRRAALEALRGITIISASSLDGVRKYADEMLARIEAIPSADVAPVRRGYWIGGELGSCSVCGHHGCASDIWTGCWAKGQTFCPACGALLGDEYYDEEDGTDGE